MISPGWATFIFSVFAALVGIAASWAVVNYKVQTTEKALASLEAAIRTVGVEIKGLLFNAHDAGRPFYQRADDCRSHRMECSKEVDERLLCLEDKAHTHEAPRN